MTEPRRITEYEYFELINSDNTMRSQFEYEPCICPRCRGTGINPKKRKTNCTLCNGTKRVAIPK